MVSILAGLAGAACCVGVWNAVDRAEGAKVFAWGAAALALFIMSFAGNSYRAPHGCYTDWDGRSNSEVCN